MNENTNLSERIQRLEDAESARRLMGSYFDFIDRGYDLEGLRTLFTEDFVWDTNIAPKLTSRQQFLDFQGQNTADIKWAFHLVVPIHVDAGTGGKPMTGQWHVMGMHTMVRPTDRSQKDAVFYTAVYNVEFARETGGWKMKHMKMHIHQLSTLKRGWVEEPFYWSRK